MAVTKKMKAGGELMSFLTGRRFWKHVLLICAFLLACIFLTYKWMQLYTRHGQSLELPDYTGWNLEEALQDASENTFRMFVLDSIHIVGKPGHEILQQKPPPGSQVKENRTIYVTVTKYVADKISVSRLPLLYGKNYQRKKKELLDGFEINSTVVGKRYDPGESDHILVVIYKGDTIIDRSGRDANVLIEKGGTLDFILSERSGGRIPIPNLICKTYAEAQFLLESVGLFVGEIYTDGQPMDPDNAYVTEQSPPVSEGSILMGQPIMLTLNIDRPADCK